MLAVSAASDGLGRSDRQWFDLGLLTFEANVAGDVALGLGFLSPKRFDRLLILREANSQRGEGCQAQ